MDVQYIKTNSRGHIQPDNLALNKSLIIVLIDEHNTPIARYEFKSDMIKSWIKYLSTDSKIHFNINPNMTYEIIAVKQQ